ncbi:MAG: site-specific integrase [Actinobacteria bacterium]|nr:site-specific integrase [Actinomycetota bacterium]
MAADPTEWIRSQTPLPTFGRCRAKVLESLACPDWADSTTGFCSPHHEQAKKQGIHGRSQLEDWFAIPRPLAMRTAAETIDFSYLTEDLFRETVWNIGEDLLQQSMKLSPQMINTVLRSLPVGCHSLVAPEAAEIRVNHDPRRFLKRWRRRTSLALSSPKDEVHRDAIRLAVLDDRFSDKHTLSVEDVSQPWLRSAVASQITHLVAVGASLTNFFEAGKSARWFSAYLRTLPEGGDAPALLTRSLVCDGFRRWLDSRREGYLEWLGLEGEHDAAAAAHRRSLEERYFLPSHGGGHNPNLTHLKVSAGTRTTILRRTQELLDDQRELLTALGCSGWRLHKSSIPTTTQTRLLVQEEHGTVGQARALPQAVAAQLDRHFHLLGEDGTPRNMIEFIRGSGRRPEDTIEMHFNCLSERVHRTADGTERTHTWLTYTDRLKDGRGGHPVSIPLFTSTAAVVRRQQAYVRRTHPKWFNEEGQPKNPNLRLFPTRATNPQGTRGVSAKSLGSWIGQWVGRPGARRARNIRTIPQPLITTDGTPYPASRITPYTFRHTFGQDLWDAGVAIDTIQALMGHDDLASTQIYAQPNDEAKVAAVEALERLRQATISQAGDVVMLGVPSIGLQEHDNVTRAVMNCGRCAEKGRVSTHGGHCPLGGHCTNCTEWRASVADLPDLHRSRRRTAAVLERMEAGLAPEGVLTTAQIETLRLEVTRLDDILEKLEDELDSSPEVSDDQRTKVREMLALNTRIDLDILEPLGENRGLVRLTPDRRIEHPLAALEAQEVDDNMQGNQWRQT